MCIFCQYQNAADREARRHALYEDNNWQAYREVSFEAGHQTCQSNMLLKPASSTPCSTFADI